MAYDDLLPYVNINRIEINALWNTFSALGLVKQARRSLLSQFKVM